MVIVSNSKQNAKAKTTLLSLKETLMSVFGELVFSPDKLRINFKGRTWERLNSLFWKVSYTRIKVLIEKE